MPSPTNSITELPYKIAVLCYLYDDAGNVLLLHRTQSPNAGMYSPIGGKLHAHEGESPQECAIREIREESHAEIAPKDIRLTGMITERAYEGETHWMLFLFEVTRPIAHEELGWTVFEEGTLEWVPMDEVLKKPIPDTDRQIMWRMVQEHRGGFFVIHIDCSVKPMVWTVTESAKGEPIRPAPSGKGVGGEGSSN